MSPAVFIVSASVTHAYKWAIFHASRPQLPYCSRGCNISVVSHCL